MLQIDGVDITVVDPSIDADLVAKYAGRANVHVHKGLSLDVLKTLKDPFDCILIDGDHNWYTVYHELKAIQDRGLLMENGTIFFHDVCWPYARRDMYYQPELIPKEFMQPYEKKGIVQGQSELSDASSTNAGLCNASHEGGPRNGVLTAIEDFVNENAGRYKFFRVRKQLGLGVLLKSSSWAGNLVFTKYFVKTKLREALRRPRVN